MSQRKSKTLHLIVPLSAIGIRLDKYLGGVQDIGSRSRALHLIQEQFVKVNDIALKGSYLLKGNEFLTVVIPEADSVDLQPLELELKILFEDEFLIVLHKPSGLVVHPGAGHTQDTLVNALMAHSKDFSMKFGEVRPGIVHRLDKDTSGIMVVAKSDQVHEALSLQFKNRSISRHYLAVTAGAFKLKQGTITSFLARHPKERKRFSSVRDSNKKIIRDFNLNPGTGKWSHTDFQVIGFHSSGMSYVKLKLHTGRTHQIRVHLSEMGFPILGDEIYGSRNHQSKQVPRLALHAAELGFMHPVTKEDLSFQEDWPEDLKSFISSHFMEKEPVRG